MSYKETEFLVKNIENDKRYIEVNLTDLHTFVGDLYDEKGMKYSVTGNPFYVPEDYLTQKDKNSEAMKNLHASIEKNGLLTPLLVRPAKDGSGYEILSGYRRKKICEKLSQTRPEFQKVGVIVIDCTFDDDIASTIITSSNVQRKTVSLLEKIKSCGRMYRAMRHQGVKNDNEKENKLSENTSKIVGSILGLGASTVRQYSRLLNLPEDMLNIIANKQKTPNGQIRLSIRAGDSLSYLNELQLKIVNEFLQDNMKNITDKQAKLLKEKCKNRFELTLEEMQEYFSEVTQQDKINRKKRVIVFDDEKLTKYFPNKNSEEIREIMYTLLDEWQEKINVISENYVPQN